MTQIADKVTRFDSTLVDSAIAEGRRQNRTGRQQLEYWARIGQAMTAHETSALSRVQQALSGTLPTADLTDEEGRLFHAEVDVKIADSLSDTDYQATLAARGITTVVLDEQGRLTERSPDGTTRLLDTE